MKTIKNIYYLDWDVFNERRKQYPKFMNDHYFSILIGKGKKYLGSMKARKQPFSEEVLRKIAYLLDGSEQKWKEYVLNSDTEQAIDESVNQINDTETSRERVALMIALALRDILDFYIEKKEG